MPNALTTPLGGAVPAHIQKAFAAVQGNAALAAGVSAGYPIISYKGKVWHIVEGGERTLVTVGEGRNANDPAASLEAVIVLANPALNKVYYPDGYEEGSTERPLCHSDDGILPSNDAQEKQSKACGICPHNEWGSKISDTGSRGKACADSRRMAIASPDDLENPMLLRCPAASLKTLLSYGQQLDKRGWPYFALVTRIGFDSSLAYPALTFTPERWLDESELAQVQAMQADDLVLNITAMRPQPMATATAPAATVEEDAFARMEKQAAAPAGPTAETAPAPAPGTAGAPLKRKRKAQATPAEVAAAVQPQPEPEPEEAMHAEPEPAPVARKGFGAKKATNGTAAPAQARAAPPPAADEDDDTLGDEALAELEGVLSGFDDEDEGDEA
jgi:hypothetical protein